MRVRALTAILMAVGSLPALAGAPPVPPSPARAAFERLKGLEGTWTGKAGEDGPGEAARDATVVYKVTAAGSAVQETLFPGTPHEMVTFYHLDGDRLVLTHYCAAGNQPHMELESGGDPSVLAFRFASATNMREGDLHMHSVRLTLVDADHLRAVWASMKGGQPAGNAVFDLARRRP